MATSKHIRVTSVYLHLCKRCARCECWQY